MKQSQSSDPMPCDQAQYSFKCHASLDAAVNLLPNAVLGLILNKPQA